MKSEKKCNLLLNKRKKGVLIAVHRGSASGNIIENTYAACISAVKQGGDIVEIDVSVNIDKKPYLFHDGNEPRLLGLDKNIKTLSSEVIDATVMRGSHSYTESDKVQVLTDVLPKLKGETLINLDRCWNEWDVVFPIIKQFGMENQVIVKSEPLQKHLDYLEEHGQNLLYMPIVKTTEEIELVLTRNINTVAVEILFKQDDSPVIHEDLIKRLKEQNILVWMNAIDLGGIHNLSAFHGDYVSILDDPEKGWGFLLKKGADIIQTDWPAILRDYLQTKQ